MSRNIFSRNFVSISGFTNVADALTAIGANFEVEKRDIFIADENGDNQNDAQRAAGFSAMVRKDNEDFLGIVSSNYGVIQYLKGTETTQDLVNDGEAAYGFGHVYNKGERLYLTMTDGSVTDLGNGHNVRSYFTLTATHDGTGAFEIAPTFVDDATGAVLTFGAKGKIWTKHSKHVDGRIDTLRHRLAKVQEFFGDFVDVAKKLATVRLSALDAEGFVKELIPGDSTRSQNIRDKVIASWLGGPQAVYASCNNTLLGLYLAFCYYADNDKIVRESKKVRRDSAEIAAVLDGEAARQKAEAYAQTVELARKLGIL